VDDEEDAKEVDVVGKHIEATVELAASMHCCMAEDEAEDEAETEHP